MSTEVAINYNYTQEQKELIRKTIWKADLTEDEFTVAISIASKYQLDPMLGQIYVWKDPRKGLVSFVGINGLRLIAARSGQYDGSEVSCEMDAHGKILYSDAKVWRKDSQRAYTHRCYMSEFYQDNKPGTWGKMPAQMLMKCSESHALKKAFPAEMSGLYIEDEIDTEAKEPKDVTPKNQLPKPEIDPVLIEQLDQKIRAMASEDQLQLVSDFCKHFKVKSLPLVAEMKPAQIQWVNEVLK
jgi:phage recombination protein Bet